MEVRFQQSPQEVKGMDTDALRKNMLIENLMSEDALSLVYAHYDRLVIGGANPVAKKLSLDAPAELRADYFLERRELGIINVGGNGRVEADNQLFELRKLECLYLGKGIRSVRFASEDSVTPAVFYLLSAPAHHGYPMQKLSREAATPVAIGDGATSNRRTIYKYIHADGIQSCQLVMGLTVLETGSVWNTMPCHTHSRRTEVYFYFDLPSDQAVFHFMGEPRESRHLLVHNNQAVISPPWSIHAGCGTSNYGFIWGMAGENFSYTDMDPVAITEMR